MVIAVSDWRGEYTLERIIIATTPCDYLFIIWYEVRRTKICKKQKTPNIRGRLPYDSCSIYNNGVLDMVRDIKDHRDLPGSCGRLQKHTETFQDPAEGCRNKQQVLSPNHSFPLHQLLNVIELSCIFVYNLHNCTQPAYSCSGDWNGDNIVKYKTSFLFSRGSLALWRDKIHQDPVVGHGKKKKKKTL